jgi:hypothetical protein
MKREFAFDKRFIFYIFISLLSSFITFITVYGLIDEFSWDLVLFAVLFCGMSVAAWINMLCYIPCGYSFDKESVNVYYVFCKTERALWKSVYQIEIDYTVGSHGRYGRKLFTTEYIISFFDESHNGKVALNVRRSRRTRKMIEKYWDGKVEGYFSDSVKKWFEKRSKKKAKAAKKYLTDEIMPLEREVRAELREALKQLQHLAEQDGFVLDAEFIYITSDGSEFSKRPDENYTYTADVRLYLKEESSDPRAEHIEAELLYVRAGRSKWRGVKNGEAASELRQTINEILSEIRTVGFDKYCEDYCITFKSMQDD